MSAWTCKQTAPLFPVHGVARSMAATSPRPRDPWLRAFGYAIPLGVASAIVVVTILHTLQTEHVAAWVRPVEIGTSIGFTALLTAGVLWFSRTDPEAEHVLRLGFWTLGGGVYFASLVAFLILGQVAAGGRIQEPWITTWISSLGGMVVTFLVGVYDVAHRRAADEAEALARRLGFLNDLLRHDVRNDASIIIGNTELVEDEIGPSEELAHIAQAAEHIVELTNIVRVFDEEDDQALGTTRLRPILSRAVEHTRATAPNATIRFDADAFEDVEILATNAIGSVFVNLLQNAVQHHDRDEPQVDVEVQVLDEHVQITIADDGPGIPPDVREHLFEEGVKGDRSNGSGLGLHLVHELVTARGGTIEVQDRTPRGTMFEITLPRA